MLRRRSLIVLGWLTAITLLSLCSSNQAVAPQFLFVHESSPYNASKVALLVENRPLHKIAPILLHFIAVVPPDWRFRFMGSLESVEAVNKSAAVREQVRIGKLDLTYIPANMSTAGQEMISRFFTTLWLYETVLQPAEWLLVFQTDSIICANSRLSLDDFLEYDWIGAPWSPDGQWGGNGGLSLRRVSRIIEILRNQQRADDSEPEDVWLSERMGHHPRAKVANGTVSLRFSGEMYSGEAESTQDEAPNNTTSSKKHSQGNDGWRDGFYEPLGYHTGGGGVWLHGPVWGTPEMRKHIWQYCPEIKMTLAMDVARYVPGNCGAVWKRVVEDGTAREWDETGGKELPSDARVLHTNY